MRGGWTIILACFALAAWSDSRAGHYPAAFYAHKNYERQEGGLDRHYTLVTFPAKKFDTTDAFDVESGAWHPPAGPVHLSAQIFWALNAASERDASFVIKIIKNGGDVCAGIGNPLVGFPGLAVAAVNCDDLSRGDDYYQVVAYGTSAHAAGDLVIDGHPAHSYFSGGTN